MQASWNGAVIARSDHIVMLEGNACFPLAALDSACFQSSTQRSVRAWKEEASDFDVVVAAQVNANAAWTYRDPRPAAEEIRGLVAFWKGVTVA